MIQMIPRHRLFYIRVRSYTRKIHRLSHRCALWWLNLHVSRDYRIPWRPGAITEEQRQAWRTIHNGKQEMIQ